jgi:hypothetical protein
MVQVFDENNNPIGYINPSIAIPCNGEIVKINKISYIVTHWEYYFTGDYSSASNPLSEQIPSMFVKKVL